MITQDLAILKDALGRYDEQCYTNTEYLLEEIQEMQEKAECYDRIKEITYNSKMDSDEAVIILQTIKNKINYTEKQK